MLRDEGADDKGKQKKKIKEKKTSGKLKSKEGEPDEGGWTQVKSSSLTAAVCSVQTL